VKAFTTLLLIPIIAIILSCLGCKTTPKDGATKTLTFKFGTNSVQVTDPHDTEIDDLMLSKDGVLRLKGYRSTVSLPAVENAKQEAQFKNFLLQSFLQRADQRIDQVGVPLARSYGLPVQPLAPMPPYVAPTNATSK